MAKPPFDPRPPRRPVRDESLRRLLLAALAVRQRAYAPYSNFPVGAAVLGSDGKVYAGCNVENASYPVGICAERNALGQAVARGCTSIRAAVLVTGSRPPAPPCGMCLQAFAEFGDAEMPLLLANPAGDEARHRLQDLLPQGFRLQR